MSELRRLIREMSEPGAPAPAALEAGFAEIFAGEADPAQIGAFIMALKLRPLSVDMLVAGARALRAKAVAPAAPAQAVDTCGVGGDGLATLNISTAAAIVAAGAGVIVAKHGGRAVSSKAGSAETLAALGVNLATDGTQAAHAMREAGLAFFFAAHWHAGMAQVAPVRQMLGFRTIFNLLGPLANPSGVRRQVLGVYCESLAPLMASALIRLGAEHAFVVAGMDGMDEISVCAPSFVIEARPEGLRRFVVTPGALGLPRAEAAALAGGGPEENAAAMRALLAGAPGAFRDAVCANAGAAIVLAGLAATLSEGVRHARTAIDSGAAAGKLGSLIALSNATAPAASSPSGAAQ